MNVCRACPAHSARMLQWSERLIEHGALSAAASQHRTDLVDNGQADLAVPRDNVIFEAGYFIGLKGKRNVLIIRESGSKMPVDLGGISMHPCGIRIR